MSADICKIKTLTNVLVQENGIIRDSAGSIIGRLSKNVTFDSLKNIRDDEDIMHLRRVFEAAWKKALAESKREGG